MKRSVILAILVGIGCFAVAAIMLARLSITSNPLTRTSFTLTNIISSDNNSDLAIVKVEANEKFYTR